MRGENIELSLQRLVCAKFRVRSLATSKQLRSQASYKAIVDLGAYL